MLTLWTAIDPYRKVENFMEHPGFIMVEWSCTSDYVFIWFGLEHSYIILLSTAVIVVAIKSKFDSNNLRTQKGQSIYLPLSHFWHVLFLLLANPYSCWFIFCFSCCHSHWTYASSFPLSDDIACTKDLAFNTEEN